MGNISNKKNKKNYSLQVRLGIIFLTSVLLSACVSSPLQAPCDAHASFCGNKTKINHW